MYNGKYFQISNFKGGYAGNLPDTQIDPNQASDLDNIVILPNGKGWRSRLGNSKLNSVALNSAADIQGIGYLLQADQDEWLVAVAGTQFLHSANIGASFTDASGAIVINAAADNLWTLFPFNDAIIAFGGPPDSPDTPFRWPGTGNAAALGGSPPSAYGGLSTNNRVFAYRTAALPSTIQWTIIGNAADWTGSGSGSAVIGSLSDGQRITGAIMISTNYMLIFKENSVHQMVTSQAPFPTYSLFDNVGAPGKHAMVNIDGIVFFISSEGKMFSTNGETLQRYPAIADDLWNSVQSARYPFIVGARQKGKDYDWLIWCVSTSGSTNTVAIIWDITNETWLQCTTGYKFNTVGFDSNKNPYFGDYAGFIFKPDQSGVFADASESGAGTITAFWQSGFINPDKIDKITDIKKMITVFTPKASGNITVDYGFDGVVNGTQFTIGQTVPASETYGQSTDFLTGRGNTFEFKISQSSSTIDTQIEKVLLAGKVAGQKGQTED